MKQPTVFVYFSLLLLFSSSCLGIHSLAASFPRKIMSTSDDTDQASKTLRIAHIGNSIQYFNDSPRVLQAMLSEDSSSSHDHQKKNVVRQDSCLRGGATLLSLWTKGNGMRRKFAAPQALQEDGSYDIGSPSIQKLIESAAWDFIILNDHTQSPARPETRNQTKTAIQQDYWPLFQANSKNRHPESSGPVIIWLQTPAYRKPVKDSQDLGSVQEFTDKLWKGYQEYQRLVPGSKIAPVGMAYQYLHQNQHDMWERLFAQDDFHPSPHGTLLQCFVLYCTIRPTLSPPRYNRTWFEKCRYRQPPEQEELPLPTAEEGELLRQVAFHTWDRFQASRIPTISPSFDMNIQPH